LTPRRDHWELQCSRKRPLYMPRAEQLSARPRCGLVRLSDDDSLDDLRLHRVATHFPQRMRSGILGGFFASASVGSVLGVVLGGLIASRFGRRASFGVVGASWFSPEPLAPS